MNVVNSLQPCSRASNLRPGDVFMLPGLDATNLCVQDINFWSASVARKVYYVDVVTGFVKQMPDDTLVNVVDATLVVNTPQPIAKSSVSRLYVVGYDTQQMAAAISAMNAFQPAGECRSTALTVFLLRGCSAAHPIYLCTRQEFNDAIHNGVPVESLRIMWAQTTLCR